MNRLARFLAIRPGEGRLVALVAALFATVEAGRGFGEIGADTLFLSRFGAEFLPWLYIGLGLVSLVAMVGFGAALGRLRRGPFLVGLLASFVAVLVLLRLAVGSGASSALPVMWLVVYVVGAILGTMVWALVGGVLDARQAKRIFPICTSAAIAGGFAGTLAAGPVARIVGTESLLAVEAAFLVAAAAATAAIARRSQGKGPARSRRSLVAELGSGFDYVRRSPLMRLVAIAYVLFAVLFFSVTFPFLRLLSETYPAEADLATALGFLSAAVTAVSFVVSLTLANRVFARFGVATAALVLPLVYLGGFALWLVGFTVATAVAVRFAQQVAQRGLSNAAWSAFYNVVPAERRAQVLAFNDGVPGQIGIALSGILLLIGSLLAPTQVFALGAAAALACTWVVLQIRRRYAQSLVATLRAGLAEQVLEGGPGLAALARDPRVVDELRTGLDDASPGVRRLAAEMLRRIDAREATGSLEHRLEDPDPTVRVAALEALARLRPDATTAERAAGSLRDEAAIVRAAAIRALAALAPTRLSPEFDRLAGDAHPIVRGELAIALVHAGEEDRPHAMLANLVESAAVDDRIAGLEAVGRLGGHSPSPELMTGLADPSPAVRGAAVRAVAALDGSGDTTSLLVASLGDAARPVRLAAAEALNERIEEAAPAILDVLSTGSEVAQSAALAALRGHGPEFREPLLAWALAQVDRAVRLRDVGRSLDHVEVDGRGARGGSDGSCEGFLRFLVGQREREMEERLLSAVALLGAPEASGLIRRCLGSTDADTRAQAVEALDTLGDRELARSVVRLLEHDAGEPTSDTHQVLASLVEDRDPWIRALAIRALSERLAHEWGALAERAGSDSDPTVRAAISLPAMPGGPAMPETSQTLGEMERMLFLRRVPLFSELSPEDLQRLAAAAIERFYPSGDALVREGELGDELVVIVEGSVRVVRDEGGSERLLGTYEAGDHIGELAVLRERPRAATVIAQDDGVRGLVIGGDGLKAILRERPEASMAMLATLAERISRQ